MILVQFGGGAWWYWQHLPLPWSVHNGCIQRAVDRRQFSKCVQVLALLHLRDAYLSTQAGIQYEACGSMSTNSERSTDKHDWWPWWTSRSTLHARPTMSTHLRSTVILLWRKSFTLSLRQRHVFSFQLESSQRVYIPAKNYILFCSAKLDRSLWIAVGILTKFVAVLVGHLLNNR